MKKIILLFVLVLGLSSVAQASDATKAIVDSYLQIHAALAADKVEGIKPAANAIAAQAARMGAAGAGVEKAAKQIAAAADVKAAREAFGPLTEAVVAVAKAEDWKDVSGVKLGYCPMVNKSWLQKDGAVSNPYYGKSMATCGDLKDPRK
jgi:uncharacterized protein DUF3347